MLELESATGHKAAVVSCTTATVELVGGGMFGAVMKEENMMLSTADVLKREAASEVIRSICDQLTQFALDYEQQSQELSALRLEYSTLKKVDTDVFPPVLSTHACKSSLLRNAATAPSPWEHFDEFTEPCELGVRCVCLKDRPGMCADLEQGDFASSDVTRGEPVQDRAGMCADLEQGDFASSDVTRGEPVQAASALATRQNSMFDVVSDDENEADGSSESSEFADLGLSRWEHMYQRLMHTTSCRISVLHPNWRRNGRESIGTVLKNLSNIPSASSSLTYAPAIGGIGAISVVQAHQQSMRFQGKLDKPEIGLWTGFVRPTALEPYCVWRLFWDIVCVLLWSFDVVVLPLQVFSLSVSMYVFLGYFELGIAVFWTLDVVMSFLTGYQTPDGYIVVDLRPIAWKYVKSWLIFDAALALTTWVAWYSMVGNVAEVLRLLTLVRAIKVERRIQELMGGIRSEVLFTIVGLVKAVIIIAILNHYAACAWYLLGTWSKDDSTWLPQVLDPGFTQFYAYLTSFHYSLCHFTPASMEVHPSNHFERLFSVGLIFIGLIVFSAFLGLIQRAALHLQAYYSRQLHDEMQVRRFFAEHGISRELASRVRRFMTLNMAGKRRRIRQNDIATFKVLPRSILHDLAVEQFKPYLLVHPFFSMYNKSDPQALRDLCKSGIEERHLLPEEELFATGHVQTSFFVVLGTILYTVSVVAPLTISEGEWACEEALWSGVSLIQAPMVNSGTAAELILVRPAEMRELARRHVRSLALVLAYAEKFIARFNLASLDYEYTNLLFNDPDEIGNLLIDTCNSMQTDLRRFGFKRFSG
eukprot:TRINITY_DN9475_c0_g1_i4.p1 TRINITY_DN9475_c0_g1~~TRINITY_DN9475_c0_g1_i4.p1  ORF type:complete len:849 (+),score=100.08 TRINITY_DN9475_c0_g1_i4:100-2547(+)